MKTILKKTSLFWLPAVNIIGFTQSFTKKWATCFGCIDWDETKGVMQTGRQFTTSTVVKIN